MDDYNRELSFGSSESRYAEIRAQREQRRQTRTESPDRPHRESPQRNYNPYEEPLDDDIFGPRPRGSFAKILLTQAVVCMLLVGLLFLAQRVMPNTYRQLNNAYAAVMQTDMSAREVWAAAAGVFDSMRDEITVVAPYRESEESPEEEPTDEPASEAYESDDEVEVDETEAETTQEIEVEVPPAAGGADITPVARPYSFLPLRTTMPLVNPVPYGGRISSGFGYRVHPITGEPGLHAGIDIAAPEGTPIVAAFHGTVRRVSYDSRSGNFIILDHGGGMQTLYAHCYAILVEEGMVLRAGERIALVGSTGDSTGPHLHFEIRVNGVRANPEPLL